MGLAVSLSLLKCARSASLSWVIVLLIFLSLSLLNERSADATLTTLPSPNGHTFREIIRTPCLFACAYIITNNSWRSTVLICSPTPPLRQLPAGGRLSNITNNYNILEVSTLPHLKKYFLEHWSKYVIILFKSFNTSRSSIASFFIQLDCAPYPTQFNS